jgi:hypothetical protein
MRSDSWFGRLWTRLKDGILQDVPASLQECEVCREVNCTQERWLTCARRLAGEAPKEGTWNDAMPSVTGRTDEMPGIFATDDPQDAPTENETTESSDQHRAISSSGD